MKSKQPTIEQPLNENENQNSLLFSKENYLEKNQSLKVELIQSQIIASILEKSLKSFNHKTNVNEKSLLDIQDEIICSFWVCVYLNDFKKSNTLVEKYTFLHNFKPFFINQQTFKKFTNELNVFGRKYNSLIFEKLVHLKEEYLCSLVIQCDMILNEETISNIIKNKMFSLLKLIIQRNIHFTPDLNIDSECKTSMSNGSIGKSELAIRKISYSFIFAKILELKMDLYHIKNIVSWQIPTRENVLASLLENGLDELAIDQLELFKDYVNEESIIIAIKQCNDIFISTVLNGGYFPPHILYTKIIQNEILVLISNGQTLMFALNLICLMKPSYLSLDFSRKIISGLKDMFMNVKINKKLFLCSNPFFAICLASEVLEMIGSRFSVLSIQSRHIVNEILEFGGTLTEKIEDEQYYRLIMSETDFQGRSVVDIICLHKYTKLLKDEKSEIMFQSLWSGESGYENVESFSVISNCHNIAFNNINVSGRKGILDALENENNRRKDIEFILQNRYRMKAAEFFFWYEFVFNFIILILFNYINITFIKNSFNLDDDIDKDIFYFTGFLNFTLIFNTFFRLIYNFFSDHQIPWDYWTLFDSFVSLINLINLMIILSSFHPEVYSLSNIYVQTTFLEYTRSLKYFIGFVVSCNWIRAIIFFLCIRGTSSVLVTLVNMVKNTLSFLVILSGYMLIATTIFYMVFNKTDNDYAQGAYFNSFSYTLNFLFDAMVTNIQHPPNYPTDYEISHRIILAIHCLVSNVLLLNYLIAILMLVFDLIEKNSLEREFNLRSSVYYYSMRFNSAMLDSTYGNFILIQPPFNLLNFISLFVVFFKETSKSLNNRLNYINFILTNIILSIFCLFYLILISPYVWVRVFFLNFKLNLPNKSKFFLTISWIFIGIFYLIYHCFLDTWVFLIVLGKNYNQEEKKDQEEKIRTKNINYEIFYQISKMVRKFNKFLKSDIQPNLIIMLKKSFMELVQNERLDKVIKERVDNERYETISTEKATPLDLNIHYRKPNIISTSKSKVLDMFITVDKKNKKEFIITDQEIYDKIDSFVDGFVVKDYRGDYLDMNILSKIFSKKYRVENIETVLKYNLSILTETIKQMQKNDNYNYYGLVEYFDDMNRDLYRGIKEKIDSINKLSVEIPDRLKILEVDARKPTRIQNEAINEENTENKDNEKKNSLNTNKRQSFLGNIIDNIQNDQKEEIILKNK